MCTSSVRSDDEGVAVLDRIRPWLSPVLVALSANSPFWQGADSGYGSYRSRVWGRWPSAGPVEVFGSADRYHEQVRAMVDTGALHDEGMIYFDARLSPPLPHRGDPGRRRVPGRGDPVLIAALVRALVETAARAWRAGEPPPGAARLLRLAAWRAGRSGLRGELLHPATLTPAPAQVVTHDLLHHVARALSDCGDLDLVTGRLRELHRRGNGAEAQRASLVAHGNLGGVVGAAVERTTA